MSGVRMIYVSQDLKVFRVYQPKNGIYKPVPQLANESVLQVTFYYETYKRNPIKLLDVYFDRLQLDSHGQYHFTQEEIDRRTRNFSLFAYHTSETLSQLDDVIPIPSTLDIPNQYEKQKIGQYLKGKLPNLYPMGSYIIERAILSRINKNNENKNLIREASRIKKSRNNI